MGIFKSIFGAYQSIFFRNAITIFGGTLTTISVLAMALLTILSVGNVFDAAYVGIIIFMILPGFFILGLLIIPIGIYLGNRGGEGGATDSAKPVFVLDLTQAKARHTVFVVGFLSIANIFIISLVSYKGIHYSESVEFCGQICHEVMKPEYTAYLNSPHSSVRCAECHIGPGAPWFVRSKLSGLSQVLAVTFNTYETPIPTPVANLRPSRETCEQCHWPEKFTGDNVVVNHKYEEDEDNSRLSSVLVMHIGGGNAQQHGIHSWHIDEGKVTRYLPATEDHQEISLVRVTEADGTVRNYAADGFEGDPASIPDEQMEMMDCIDCHNRPTHIYHMPGKAMDLAMSKSLISPELPFIKKVGLEALQNADKEADPDAYLAEQVRSYYAENYAELAKSRAEDIDAAVGEIQAIFNRNVFPKMKVTWGTYPNNLGHNDFPGCFRCHDEGHSTADGEVISQDCTSCHQVLAWDEPEPEILATLGLN